MSACPCGGASFESCCAPRHLGQKPAETAEALMRSRYTAFVKGAVDYLRATQTKSSDDAWEETKQWALSVTWLSLQIVDRVDGGEGQPTGTVEFIARYLEDDDVTALHERSTFKRDEAGRWIYDEGKPSVTRTPIGRNDPCPCGSGKKFKQCHA